MRLGIVQIDGGNEQKIKGIGDARRRKGGRVAGDEEGIGVGGGGGGGGRGGGGGK